MSHAADQLSDRWPADDPRIPRQVAEWLGPREWLWSESPRPGRRVAIVSSRLPRLLAPHGSSLAGLRSALERIRTAGHTIVVSTGTAGSDLVLRGAIRQCSPIILLQCDESRGNRAGRAARACFTDAAPVGRDLLSFGRPSSTPAGASRAGSAAPEIESTPTRDRAAIAWADEVIVLQLRSGGNLHRLLRHRLQRGDANVLLVDLPGLHARKARDELLGLGAKLWKPTESKFEIPNSKSQISNQRMAIANRQARVPCPPAENWTFLTHTTRARIGPWPGQSRDDYLDSLLDARPDADHSPLAALTRIVSQRRLIASDRTIRQGYAVVSFTAVPLAEIPQLRIFRSHRGRWDFEPYGLCISRGWLEAHGARPVIYTGSSDWLRLPHDEQPYFQYVRHLDSTKAQPNQRAGGIDWSLEREWRHVGDLDLSGLTAADATLFVPTADEARKLLEISPWPVTVLA